MAVPATPSNWPDVGAVTDASKSNMLQNLVLCAPNAQVNLFPVLAADTITAKAGGGQSTATQITTQAARVTVVATGADSVKLPPSVAGLAITLCNSGANSMQVFGTSPDTINGAATGTGVAHAASDTQKTYRCYTAGAWFST